MLETRNQPIGARAPIGASAPIGPHGGGPNQDDEGGCNATDFGCGRPLAARIGEFACDWRRPDSGPLRGA